MHPYTIDHGPSGRGAKELKDAGELLSSSNLQKLSSSKVEEREQALISDCKWFH